MNRSGGCREIKTCSTSTWAAPGAVEDAGRAWDPARLARQSRSRIVRLLTASPQSAAWTENTFSSVLDTARRRWGRIDDDNTLPPTGTPEPRTPRERIPQGQDAAWRSPKLWIPVTPWAPQALTAGMAGEAVHANRSARADFPGNREVPTKSKFLAVSPHKSVGGTKIPYSSQLGILSAYQGLRQSRTGKVSRPGWDYPRTHRRLAPTCARKVIAVAKAALSIWSDTPIIPKGCSTRRAADETCRSQIPKAA